VGVDLQIAFSLDFQVDQAVTRQQVEHVMLESDARVRGGFARAIEIERRRGPWFPWSDARVGKFD